MITPGTSIDDMDATIDIIMAGLQSHVTGIGGESGDLAEIEMNQSWIIILFELYVSWVMTYFYFVNNYVC